jgi:MFS family permease
LLVGPTGRLALSQGFDELSGAYATAALLFIFACIVIFTGLRPDPRDLGQEVARLFPDTSSTSPQARPLLQILRQPATVIAVLAMALGQMVMVMVMVITALHMRGHQHGLGSISLVVSSHTFGMFGFSILSGRLADRWGRGPVIITGAATLLLACLSAPLSPQVLPLAVSLFLLGLGWNFCFVGGSTLLADQLSPAERARTQGFNDLLVGLASASASLGSGLIFATLGFTVMALAGAVFSLAPLGATVVWSYAQRRAASTALSR